MPESGTRHGRCGGTWRGPFHLDARSLVVCNTCGQETDQMPDLLTPAQAAARLGVSPRQFRRYVAAGKITPTDRTPGGHGRYAPAALDALKPPT